MKMENHDFKTQEGVSRRTDLLVGVHGNGLSHCAFMRPKRNVVEIYPTGMIFQYDYYTLAKMMGHEYTCIYSGQAARVHALTNETPPSATANFDTEIVGEIVRQLKKMH